MKRGAITHHKTAELASILGLERWGAVGIMESLYHATAERTPRGDIGRLTDRQIAYYIGWPESDATRLIDALIQARLIDATEDASRLVVHDWHDHADDTTKKRLARSGETFATLSEGGSVRTSADMSGNVQTCPDNGGQRRTTAEKSACLSHSHSHSLGQNHVPEPRRDAHDDDEPFDLERTNLPPLTSGRDYPAHMLSGVSADYPDHRRRKGPKQVEAIRTAIDDILINGPPEAQANPPKWLADQVRRFREPGTKLGQFCPNSITWFVEGWYANEAAWAKPAAESETTPRKRAADMLD